MQTFRNCAAQGDVRIDRVDSIPGDAIEQTPTAVHAEEDHIIAHSETGHNHWINAETVRFYAKDEFISYLDVRAPTPLVHEKSGSDAHLPIMIPRGKFKITRQREWTPEGFRRVED